MITFLGKILVFGLIPVVLGWIAWEEFFAEEETLTRPRKTPEPEPADPMELAVFSESAAPAPAPLPAPVFAAAAEPAPPQEARDPRVGPMEQALASTREMVEAVSTRLATAEQESVRLQQECASLHSMVQEQATELARRPEPVASDSSSDAHGQEIQRLTESLSAQAQQLAEVRDVVEGLESPQDVPEERMRAIEERVADAVRDRSLLHDQVSEVESRLESRLGTLEDNQGGGNLTAALDQVQSLVGRCDAMEASSERSEAECEELRALGDLRDQRLDEMLQSTLGLPHGDKLTKIEGLGSASAEVLNSLGIMSYKQLATLSKEDLEEISERASGLGKRIEKGHWVQKAKMLTKK